MKTTIKILAILLLFINGTGAIFGGFHLIADPSGAQLQMPLSYLEHSPFNNYLIPGIILFIVNGIFSFVAIAALFLKRPQYPLFIIAQGIVLTGWIIVQLIMLRIFYAPMHISFLVIGLLLVAGGAYLKKNHVQ